MQRSRVLHRDERVAFEYECWDAHEHREEVVVERLWIAAEKLRPHLGCGSEVENGAHVDARRGIDLHQFASVEPDDHPAIAARDREGRREPSTDRLKLWIRVDAVPEACQPRVREQLHYVSAPSSVSTLRAMRKASTPAGIPAYTAT